jgi:transcriptional regulator NrdR family protein
MKCPCGGNTAVVETRTVDNTPKRKRKCELCNQSFYTLETFLEMASGISGRKPKPKPDAKGLYSAPAAKELKAQKVDVRRKNEDRKSKVPSYFIEEEDW